ncbi:MAG: hypothetical protein LBE81_09155 [Azonexus sp.]|jgi:hypothetical protein|uniref:hypothetical protein n=1 Tax=Azonexus sp. TaxID=1872668 RepID=UPI002821EA04|nr:hypothetical protein [Azonexus sp.]MDR0776788.1 hypothetical protein [Azonexus sp.]
MSLVDDLPVSESIGVFVGVAGVDWLADGHAEPLKALLAGIFAGAVIMAVREWRKKRQKH